MPNSTPITLHRGYNITAPGVNMDIISGGLTPPILMNTGAFRVTVALATASVFNLTTTDGTTAFTFGLNSSTALSASDMFTFTFGVRRGITYNFQVETDGVIRYLQVDFIPSAEL